MKKLSYFLGWSILILLMGFYFRYFYQEYYPYKVLINQANKIPLTQTVYHPGEPLIWPVDIEQLTTGVKVDVSRQLVGDIIINFPDTSYITKKGHQKFINASLSLPPYTPPGKYQLVIVSFYHVNPVRTINITLKSDEFTVVK